MVNEKHFNKSENLDKRQAYIPQFHFEDKWDEDEM
jgi:hypothetical protein